MGMLETGYRRDRSTSAQRRRKRRHPGQRTDFMDCDGCNEKYDPRTGFRGDRLTSAEEKEKRIIVEL